MEVNKKNLFNILILSFFIMISFSFILIFDNPVFHIGALWLTVIAIIISTRFDIANPLLWFSGAFVLYCTAYPILHVMGYSVETGYSRENTFFSLLALVTVIFVVGVKKFNFLRFKNISKCRDVNNQKITQFILFSLFLILFFSVIVILVTPFNHKNDMLENRNVFFLLGVYSTRFLSFFISLYLLLFIDNNKKKSGMIITFSSVLIVLFSLFTGERDAMFRFFLILIITLFILGKINKKSLLLLFPIGMTFLILAGYFKYFFVTGETTNTLEEQPFLINFLNSDFSAAGENFQILLNNSWTNSVHGLSLIWFDFISPFISGGAVISVGNWFNDTFYPGSYSRAFTLIGEGYVAKGVIGIIIIFAVLGFMIKVLSIKAPANVYWLSLYIYSIPTIISSFRSTLGTVFTGLVRVALLSIVIHLLLNLIFNKNFNMKRNSRG